MHNDLEANRHNAIAFYRTAYLGDPGRAVELYVGAEYIQHNPLGRRRQAAPSRRAATRCTELGASYI